MRDRGLILALCGLLLASGLWCRSMLDRGQPATSSSSSITIPSSLSAPDCRRTGCQPGATCVRDVGGYSSEEWWLCIAPTVLAARVRVITPPGAGLACVGSYPHEGGDDVLVRILRSPQDLDVWCDEALARAEPAARDWRLEGR